jgi:hypothetical protein
VGLLRGQGVYAYDTARHVNQHLIVGVCRDVKVLVQGVEVHPDASVFQLWKQFAHADLFLYLVVVMSRS